MSNPLFANSKVALGFAGITIVIALVASVSFGAFTPAPDKDDRELVAQGDGETTTDTERVSEPVASAPPASGAGWGNEDFGDGWADSSVAGAGNASGRNGNGPSQSEREANFGDYNPGESNGRPPEAASTTRSAPNVVSNAAPGAPAVRPPNASSDQPPRITAE